MKLYRSPLHAGLDWPQFREDTKKYLLINEQVEIESGFRSRQEFLWTDLIQEMNNKACSSTSTQDFGSRRKFNKNTISNIFKPLFDRQQQSSTEFNLRQGPTNFFTEDGNNLYGLLPFEKIK